MSLLLSVYIPNHIFTATFHPFRSSKEIRQRTYSSYLSWDYIETNIITTSPAIHWNRLIPTNWITAVARTQVIWLSSWGHRQNNTYFVLLWNICKCRTRKGIHKRRLAFISSIYLSIHCNRYIASYIYLYLFIQKPTNSLFLNDYI